MKNRIELIDEDGIKEVFDLIDTFGMDDDDYAVLKSEQNQELYLFKIVYDNKGVNFIGIEDQEELDDAVTIYEELKAEESDRRTL